MSRSWILKALLLFQTANGILCAQESLAPKVLVVYNDSVKDSRKVAEYYAEKRGIPSKNLCRLKLGAKSESRIPAQDLKRLVLEPVRSCLLEVGKDQALYLVLTFGVPFAITGVPPAQGWAIDSYLADVWDSEGPSPLKTNPYFNGDDSKPFVSLNEWRRRPGLPVVYSVWRLDGATSSIATGLVDKALEAEQSGARGIACIDRQYGDSPKVIGESAVRGGDWDLHYAAGLWRSAGITVVEDSSMKEFGTSPAPERCDNAIFYAGWYSLNHYNDAFSWNPGAIGIHIDSASAVDPRGGTNWCANALKHGITVTSGAVAEPYRTGLPRPGGVVKDLLSGANVGDAFLRNTQWLNWMILNIGDPLYRPQFKNISH